MRLGNKKKILAYIDESGINYKKNSNNYFNDGPYALWSCVLINEKKYKDIERTFQDIAVDLLPSELSKSELHAEGIWDYCRKNEKDREQIRRYFEELIQFTTKLRVPILLGIQQKNPLFTTKDSAEKKSELDKARHSLLTLIEHQLAELNETAVLVSDLEGGNEKLKNLVNKRTQWRYSVNGSNQACEINPKYQYEYRSNFILDQLHYVDSKTSLLTQFIDNVSFVMKRSLESIYLSFYPNPAISRPSANKMMVPISEDTFNTCVQLCKIKYACFEDRDNDVRMGDFFRLSDTVYSFETKSGLQVLGSHESSSEQIIRSFTPYR